MKIQPNCLVELAYSVVTDDGRVVASSEEGGPLEFRQGSDEVPAALSAALEGKEVGDEVEVAFGPGEAFGEFNPEGIVSVPPEEFPPEVELVPGEWISVTVEGAEQPPGGGGEGDDELEMRVVEVTADAVVLDANHPLANEAVTFRVRVSAVRRGDG